MIFGSRLSLSTTFGFYVSAFTSISYFIILFVSNDILQTECRVYSLYQETSIPVQTLNQGLNLISARSLELLLSNPSSASQNLSLHFLVFETDHNTYLTGLLQM